MTYGLYGYSGYPHYGSVGDIIPQDEYERMMMGAAQAEAGLAPTPMRGPAPFTPHGPGYRGPAPMPPGVPGGCGVGGGGACAGLPPHMARFMGMSKGCDQPRWETMTFEVPIPNLAAGATVSQSIRPQKCFRIAKISAPPTQPSPGGTANPLSGFAVQLVVGVNPQIAGGSTYTPADIFSSQNQENGVGFDAVYPGFDVTLTIRNIGAGPTDATSLFFLTLFGPTVDSVNR